MLPIHTNLAPFLADPSIAALPEPDRQFVLGYINGDLRRGEKSKRGGRAWEPNIVKRAIKALGEFRSPSQQD